MWYSVLNGINPSLQLTCAPGRDLKSRHTVPSPLQTLSKYSHPALVHFIPVNIPLSLSQLELQCRELDSEKQESHVENVKLKMTNDELSRALENTSQELGLAQDQLGLLQEQAAQLQQEKEMWVHLQHMTEYRFLTLI